LDWEVYKIRRVCFILSVSFENFVGYFPIIGSNFT
jgi:hypothetical protein